MYQINLSVRDYECDLQGIVNNAVYMNYLEHARHEFLLENKVDFAELAEKGIDLVVVQSTLKYKKPLKPHDKFYVTVALEQEGRVKINFIQNIYLMDGTLMLTATTMGVASKKGRPIKPPAEMLALAATL